VEQKVDAGMDTALVRNATLDARLSGETQAREQLAQQLSDEFSRKDQTQERVADMGRLVHQTMAEVNLQEHRLSMLIAEARKRLPDRLNKKQLENIVEQEDHKFDALYVAFEDVFRGPRDEVKAKQSIYVPLLKERHIGSKNMPVLDVGCGRGEWLELMRENGLLAQGLDRNEIMIAQCRELGLDVVQGDAMSHLRTLPDQSLGAVTAFHIVEHLPFETVLAFIDETVRVLKPGGMVIFETPNPQNVLVGSMTFYYDPTHLHPLPSGMLRFFVEARGLCDVYIKDVNPYPEWVRLPDTDKGLARRLNEYFYGPQDYAIIGRKA
jgi:O-antigen chain-terminating methyltransferase